MAKKTQKHLIPDHTGELLDIKHITFSFGILVLRFCLLNGPMKEFIAYRCY